MSDLKERLPTPGPPAGSDFLADPGRRDRKRAIERKSRNRKC
jgi:hypothetical protein